MPSISAILKVIFRYSKMWCHLKNHEINRNKWDQCVNESNYPYVFIHSSILDIISPKWEALIFNDYQIIFPLTIKRKWGIRYLCNPFYVQQLGLVCCKANSNLITLQITDKLKSLFPLVDINFNSNNAFDTNLKELSWRKNYCLELHQSYTSLFSNYKGNCRRNTRLARKQELEIKMNADVVPIVELFKNNQAKKYVQFGEKQLHDFIRLFALVNKHAEATCITCYNMENELIAGAVFFIYKNRIAYVFSGMSQEGRSLSAMYLIFEALISKYALHPFILDFQGGNSPGMASFYAGFGASNFPFPNFKSVKWPLSFIK